MGKLIAVLLLGFMSHVKGTPQCDVDTDERCHEGRMTDILGSQAVFPSVHFLNAHCSHFNETVNCMVEDAKECENSKNKKMLSEYEDIQRIVSNICNENSPFRKSFLENVDCYNRILQNFRNCSASIQAEIDEFSKNADFTKVSGLRSPFKYLCLKTFIVPNCQIRETAVNCGMPATIPMRDILYGVSNLMIKTLCEQEHMAVWLDEYRVFTSEGKRTTAAAAETICITESMATEPTSPVGSRVTAPDVILGLPGDKPNIRDAILGIIKNSKGKMPKTSTDRPAGSK